MNPIRRVYNRLFRHFGKQNWWPISEVHQGSLEKRMFEIIVGAILTQNTSWKNVEKAIANLIKNDLIDIKKIKSVNKKRLAGLIRSSGYYNQKAERLKIFAGYILDRYGGRLVPFMEKDPLEIREELLSIKGIGPETADSIILYAFQKPMFVVDAYTRRLFSRLGVIKEDVSYDELQAIFHESLKDDAELFNEYHALIVEFGKKFCKKKPQCVECPLNRECKSFIYRKVEI